MVIVANPRIHHDAAHTGRLGWLWRYDYRSVVPLHGMPTMNVHDLYEQTIKSLPAAERLRLAVLILNDTDFSVS
jgi:hypothetical protein